MTPAPLRNAGFAYDSGDVAPGDRHGELGENRVRATEIGFAISVHSVDECPDPEQCFASQVCFRLKQGSPESVGKVGKSGAPQVTRKRWLVLCIVTAVVCFLYLFFGFALSAYFGGVTSPASGLEVVNHGRKTPVPYAVWIILRTFNSTMVPAGFVAMISTVAARRVYLDNRRSGE